MKKLYAKSDSKLIYEVTVGNKYDDIMELNLTLIGGWDYIDPDFSDTQGYVSSKHFIEDVQHEYCGCSYWNESIKECLKDNGYEILESLPKIN